MASLFENFRIRIKPKPSDNNQLPLVKPNQSLGTTLEELDNNATSMVNMTELNEFRTMASDRETQYQFYDQMAEDSIISSALEMYADDATQYNNKGQIIWAESEDNDVAEFANRLIDILDLNKNAWSHIYCLCKYGDVYLETFRDNEINQDESLNDDQKSDLKFADVKINKTDLGSVFEEYIEMHPNPATLFDVTRHSKTVGFIESEVFEDKSDPFSTNYKYIKQGEKVNIYPPDKYIHIMLANNSTRYPEKIGLEYSVNDKDGESDVKVREYRVNRGKSILHDIYKIYRELNLMEDSLLLNRVTRSSIIRLLQVEVGDMPKSQARELLKRVKTLIEQKNYMDKNTGTYTSMASPGPIDNIIYIPTHDGKGSISASNLGGDVDVKSISDIDYYKNKLYAGLKIPRQFFGEEADGGLAGGTSLTKLDARYARTIKRIQTAYIEGITTLINLFAIDKHLDKHVNNFTIKMVSPSTTEDQERDESLDNRVNIVSNLMQLISEDGITTVAQRKEILMYFINNYFNEPDVSDIMDDDTLVDEPTPADMDGNSPDNYGGGSANFSGPDINMDFGSDNEGFDEGGFDEETDTDTETPEPPEPASDNGFGDFTDEF